MIGACATPGAEAPLRARQVAPGVHVVLGSTNDATVENRGRVGNLGFIVGPAGTLVIETGTSARHGRELIALAERSGGQAVELALITQPLPEFIFGSAAFRARGVRVEAHEDAARLIRQRCQLCLARLQALLGEAEMHATAVIPPAPAAIAAARIEVGGRKLQLLAPGHASAPGDLAVFDLRTGVLFAGALVSNGRVPDLRDAEVERWLAALDELAALPWRVLVPGYGAPAAAGEDGGLRHTRAYLQAVRDYARGSFGRGLGLYEAVRAAREAVEFAPYAGLPGYDAFHLRNVHKLYLQEEARAFARTEGRP